MRRRDFIRGIVGSATAWPLAVRAQHPERKRRVAVLMGGLFSGDPGGHAEAGALEEGLTELGWKLGGNIDLDYRWPGAELDQVSVAANEIVAMRPDVVVSRSTPATATIRNRGVPIVFVLVTDPKGSGFVQDLGRPGGTLTGFSTFEASVGGKWLGLLKEASPAVTHVSILFNPETAPFADGYLHSAQAVAQTLGAAIVSAPCGSTADIEAAFAARSRESGGGVIGIADTFITEHRDLIIALAARYRLPAIYGNRIFVPLGGLLAYSADFPDIFHRAAGYVDRILRGARPGELPVQAPAKFTLSVNLKAARAIGLALPEALIARADEVIE
jgi:putative tryptophan/tyrosine transport system substrate-binding protein